MKILSGVVVALTASVDYLLRNILPVSLGTLPESEMLSNIKQGAEMMDFSRKRSRIIQINAVPAAVLFSICRV